MADAPTLVDAVSFLTQALLLLTSVLTLAEYVRKRDRQLGEIALMFGSLGASTVVSWLGALGVAGPWLSTLSSMAVVAHPYLIVRVVKQFRSVPAYVEWPLVFGMVASWGAVSGWAIFRGGTLPLGWAIPIILYFAYGELYAAYALVTGAYRSAGVARRRLTFAAVGTGLLGLLFVFIAVLSVASAQGSASAQTVVIYVAGPLALAAVIAFYLGFAPPRWLRRSWQLEELHGFLHHSSGRGIDQRAEGAVQNLQQTAMRLTGAARASIGEPHPDSWHFRILFANGATQALVIPREPQSPMTRAMISREVVLHRGVAPETRAALDPGFDASQAQNALFIPIASGTRVWSVLALPLDHVPLFLDESTEILKLLADQTAVALETQSLAREQEELRLRDARLAAEELRRQNVAFQEATRLKSEFLANMSHELRTPLNGIIGFADLMASGKVGDVSDTHKEFLGDILTSARHLLQLINDVLDLAKVESGRMDFRAEDADPEEIIHEVLVVLRPLAQRKSIDLRIERDAKLGRIHLDPVRLKQIVYNYASNAIKFTPERGRVTIRALAAGEDRFRVEVVDTGVGIKAEDVPKLFHEFQQLDAGMSKQHQGTGLGLALVKRLAEAQAGSVGVTSRLGAGSTFWVDLPRVAPADAELARPATTFTAVGPRVLIVEDDETERTAFVAALTSAGYEVDAAATGREALALIDEREYDAATIDLILPDAHGYDIIKALRARSGGASVAVLIVTQMAKDAVKTVYPVEGIFQKPLDPGVLAESLKRANVHPHHERPILVVDDDATVRKLMEAHLGTLGYRAALASDGREALDMAARDPPAIVILDLVMPHMDGFAFLEAFRARPEARDVPVIVWTSKDLTPDERARLHGQVQLVAYKAEGGTFALVNQLESVLRGRRAK